MSLRLARTRDEVRGARADASARGDRVALVPTMGFLHEGHLSLIDRARERADWVALSIFVNPLQFGPSEDLDRYPRDLERDLELAGSRGVDLVFAPSVPEMYPDGEPSVRVLPAPELTDRLCGARRPGHFEGVLTVVAKLFGIFTPHLAVFGRKDLQQASLIRRMALDLDMQVEVDVAPIVRERDGLAMSSRNVYLSASERESALALSRAVAAARLLFASGERDCALIRTAAMREMGVPGVEIEYVELLEPERLTPLTRAGPGAVCAVAGRVGATRLIDNVILDG